MGTVHAKDIRREETIPLDKVKARVDKVHIDGVARTKDDILIKCVNDLFNADNFEQVVLKAHVVSKKLEQLGAFKHISTIIDTSTGPDANPHGLEITYFVNERKRITGDIKTLVGNNEGSVVFGTQLPNFLGRGEHVNLEYNYGTKHASGFTLNASKPFFIRGKPRISGSIFQQGSDYIWSGFREVDRGLFVDLGFESAPSVKHSLRWEGIWRDLASLSNATSYSVREQSGHTLKSSLKHTLFVDHRDNFVLPSVGSFFQMSQEYAGLGGNVGFIKHELQGQVNLPLPANLVFQASLLGGFMRANNKDKVCTISDMFFLGGPLNLRGFNMRGAGPHDAGNALGAETYWAGGLHLYSPLPFKPLASGLGNYLRIHSFINTGNIGKFPFTEDYYQNLATLLSNLRWSYGIGLVISIAHLARFEINYCVPLRAQPGDVTQRGLQFGIGVTFL